MLPGTGDDITSDTSVHLNACKRTKKWQKYWSKEHFKHKMNNANASEEYWVILTLLYVWISSLQLHFTPCPLYDMNAMPKDNGGRLPTSLCFCHIYSNSKHSSIPGISMSHLYMFYMHKQHNNNKNNDEHESVLMDSYHPMSLCFGPQDKYKILLL